MLARDGRVQAIIDWEIWSIGDPRIDMGWYLMNTHPSKQGAAIREAPGMPSDTELISTYETVRGLQLVDQAWFDAMTRFKGGAIVAQLVKHNARRQVPDPTVARWGPHVANFIGQVHLLLASR
jgi:aminoglycoside phosphotransferase (APT) family kinase protein